MLSSSSSAIFWLRILLEAPLVIWGFWYPQSLPFSDMNDTTLVFVKVRDSQYTTAVNLCRFTGLERNELGHVHYFTYVLLSSRQAVSQYSSTLHNDANFPQTSPLESAWWLWDFSFTILSCPSSLSRLPIPSPLPPVLKPSPRLSGVPFMQSLACGSGCGGCGGG